MLRKKHQDSMSDIVYAWSFFGVVIALLAAFFVAKNLPQIDDATAQKILVPLVSLDGVLFGFTAVMVSLFLHDVTKLSERTFKRSLQFAMMAFWIYIFSILSSFLVMGLGQEYMNMPALAPVFMTFVGTVCSSVFMILIFIDEYYPLQKVGSQHS